MWEVVFHPSAREEHKALPRNERAAIDNVVEKLQAMGPQLPFPHQSAVRGAVGLRELRPRAGRSPWRALYARVEDTFVVAAVGPEAEVDRRGFDRAVAAAIERLRSATEEV
jgi:hypothetical protein